MGATAGLRMLKLTMSFLEPMLGGDEKVGDRQYAKELKIAIREELNQSI